MKRQIRTPYFEIGTKNYIYGDTVLEYAWPTLRRRNMTSTSYSSLRPWRSAGWWNRRSISSCWPPIWTPSGRAGGWPTSCRKLGGRGAAGVVVNHCEKPMSLPAIKETIQRAHELDMLVFACADTIAEAKAVAQLHPDILNPEPSELIGGAGSGVSSMDFVRESIQAIKSIYPDILVEQAAGITNGQQVYDFIMAGSEGLPAAASGIVNAKDPLAMIDEMIAATAVLPTENRR